jgi:single-stranded-DNA-specific exonuclease
MHKVQLEQRSKDININGLPDVLHPVVKRVLGARGVATADQIDYRLKSLLKPDTLGGLGQAVASLADSVEQNTPLIIVGDYDADGATGTAVAMLALTAMGHGKVNFRVPDRFVHGYGLTAELFETLAPAQPSLLLTVDNGIASHHGIEAARAAGVDVVITDHHLPGETLPRATAIVNPNLEGDAFPSKNLAGVGVVFYVMAALRTELTRRGWFEGQRQAPRLAELLDLVALGTIADVVQLDRNNRTLVAQGLERIRRGRAGAGLRALIEVAGRDPSRITATDLAFAVAPRLNAAGRLEDMSVGIECLLTQDSKHAMALALRLDELNAERRRIQSEMQEEAQQIVAEMGSDLLPEKGQRGICLFDERWHQGVVGLVASRIKEDTGRPVIAFAPDGDSGPLIKGSARSIAGFHIRDALARIDAERPGLIRKFGGHAMAAGLTLEAERLEEFCEAYLATAARGISAEQLRQVVLSDGQLQSSELCLEVAEALRLAGPWGQGFPEPLFDGHFDIIERRVVGGSHLKMQLEPVGGGVCLDAIAFNTDIQVLPEGAATCHLVYQLDVNEFRGRRSAQLLVRHIL